MQDTTSYRVIFDLTKSGYTTWHEALWALGAAVVLAVLFVIATALKDNEPRWKAYRIVAAMGITITLVIFVSTLESTWQDYSQLRSAMEHGSYRVVTGRITNLVPEPPGGHVMEQFAVGDVRFAYSSYVVTPGFSWTMARGGPIREGQRVRIAEKDGVILRLEIAR